MPQGDPRPGEIYRHFKNKYYQIVSVATHSETREKLVIYQALYDTFGVYARPYDMFISEVDHEKYPEVRDRYRFTYQVLDEDAAAGCDESAIRTSVGSYTSEKPLKCENLDVAGVNKKMLQFLDTDDMAEKYKILEDMESEITDSLIDNMAASMDLVIPEGNLDKRFEHLKYAVRTRSRFENERLRR